MEPVLNGCLRPPFDLVRAPLFSARATRARWHLFLEPTLHLPPADPWPLSFLLSSRCESCFYSYVTSVAAVVFSLLPGPCLRVPLLCLPSSYCPPRHAVRITVEFLDASCFCSLSRCLILSGSRP